MRTGKGGQFCLGPRINHAAACDNDRMFGRLDRRNRFGQFIGIGLRTPNFPNLGLEERYWIIKGFGLYILTKCQHDRTAIGRIGHHPHGARQGGQQMFRARDAVEIAADRAETIIGRNGAIAERFNLLQHRIGRAVGKHIPRNDQHRQAVGIGQRRRRHHIQRARPD